jgi:hypothetical protein
MLLRFTKDFTTTRQLPKTFEDETFESLEPVTYRRGTVLVLDSGTALRAINTGYAEAVEWGMIQ